MPLFDFVDNRNFKEMNKKIWLYVLILVLSYFIWDYVRYRHTEEWWLKRFMSYPGCTPDELGFENSMYAAMRHLERLRKFHPEKIRASFAWDKSSQVVFNEKFMRD